VAGPGPWTSPSAAGRAVTKEPLNSNYVSLKLWGVLNDPALGGVGTLVKHWGLRVSVGYTRSHTAGLRLSRISAALGGSELRREPDLPEVGRALNVFIGGAEAKNPSAISRSRSLASWAERRGEPGSRGGVSNTAPRMRGAEVPSLPARAKANRSSA
jgi:hypothetical protein